MDLLGIDLNCSAESKFVINADHRGTGYKQSIPLIIVLRHVSVCTNSQPPIERYVVSVL